MATVEGPIPDQPVASEEPAGSGALGEAVDSASGAGGTEEGQGAASVSSSSEGESRGKGDAENEESESSDSSSDGSSSSSSSPSASDDDAGAKSEANEANEAEQPTRELKLTGDLEADRATLTALMRAPRPGQAEKIAEETAAVPQQAAREALPPVEDVSSIKVPASALLSDVGRVMSVVERTMVVQGGSQSVAQAVVQGTLLVTRGRVPVGHVDEVFGPVKEPLYTVRFNNSADVERVGLGEGDPLFSVKNKTEYVLAANIVDKGTDASTIGDKEVTDTRELDFSDDEEERRARAALRRGRGGGGGSGTARLSMGRKRRPQPPHGYRGPPAARKVPRIGGQMQRRYPAHPRMPRRAMGYAPQPYTRNPPGYAGYMNGVPPRLPPVQQMYGRGAAYPMPPANQMPPQHMVAPPRAYMGQMGPMNQSRAAPFQYNPGPYNANAPYYANAQAQPLPSQPMAPRMSGPPGTQQWRPRMPPGAPPHYPPGAQRPQPRR